MKLEETSGFLDDDLICYCFNVERLQIDALIREHAITEVGDVTWFCGAGGGCGGCRGQIRDMIDRYWQREPHVKDEKIT